MTEIAAIKEFQDNIDLPYGVTVSDEASVMAIKALEKQIAKKPKKSGKIILEMHIGTNGRNCFEKERDAE